MRPKIVVISLVALLSAALASSVSACPPMRIIPRKVNLQHDVSQRLVQAGVAYMGDLRDNIASVELSPISPKAGEAVTLLVRFKQPVSVLPTCDSGSQRCSKLISRYQLTIDLGRFLRGTHRLVGHGGSPLLITIR